MTDVQQSPFLRELTSSDRRTREKALDSLTLFLKSRRDLQLIDLLKIWKGLFFCMYHCDRPLNQQSLSRSLSYTLVPSLPGQILQPFLRAFWITMSRDFHSLDRLRLDKYLYLIRCYVGVAFEIFIKKGLKARKQGIQKTTGKEEKINSKNSKKRKRTDDDEEQVDNWADLETYLDLLQEGPLCPINFNSKQSDSSAMPKGPDGIRYHIMDIWLDELEKCATDAVEDDENADVAEEDLPRTKLKDGVPMELILRPIERLKEKSPNKTVRKRAAETLEDGRLVMWGVKELKGIEDSDEDEEGWGGIED
ncbi:hypothetical protein D8B26_005885 [Coccidioides posadasii str. Silveira]|uniref:Ribosomal RNA processing protein n=3 Tax=Coccidioides posadasii TaxID=199306 RepID=E9DIE6_COCPS|nr:Nucleolar protein,Nop52 containing protein [Coccidioides posadasii C735 delta SOWgp]EER27987.1 Nucleolar protein,Nop52 containing protein [Coccidioides posadasii C735 delta SOWgp]EFW13942.1 ribosomal RNA processing protein [Coccidioides posadasii str. Silveira]KMM67984.1 hypothetical protein CPAG_04316 [Coccidioides posadasii RMSCC 3488]QVM11232.1 hypothetical protein D8B26_005885 [Coccidioides posadasii str. Silveira]|eukprot:XP_003070132.1 Nucleolar protein,Nop52 containing protein [Coccidioides posadasii C735 delta SOWgp]